VAPVPAAVLPPPAAPLVPVWPDPSAAPPPWFPLLPAAPAAGVLPLPAMPALPAALSPPGFIEPPALGPVAALIPLSAAAPADGDPLVPALGLLLWEPPADGAPAELLEDEDAEGEPED
jgi:hypothetical protein